MPFRRHQKSTCERLQKISRLKIYLDFEYTKKQKACLYEKSSTKTTIQIVD